MSQPPNDVSFVDEDQGEAYQPLPPPEGSRITIERFPDGLTIQLPAAGASGAKGMLSFAVILNGVLAFITGFVLLMFFADNLKHQGPLWVLPAFLSFFWLVGICFLLASLNMARRRAAFAYTGGTLMVIQTGLFGSKTRDFEPGDVEAVRVGPSGMTVNDVPIRELQIIDGGAAKFSLLAGRSEAELDWLAAELRAALRVPTHAS
jgi:hypothetical protein